MLDNTKQPPTIVQLDKWHENSHPYYWSQHADIEAELFEGFLAGGELYPSIHTERTGGPTPYSFHAFTSFVRMPCQRGAGEPPRDAPLQFAYSWCPSAPSIANHHTLWVRARAEHPASLHVGQPHHQQPHTATVAELAVPEGGEWAWLRLAPMVWHQAVERGDTELRVTLRCGPEGANGYIDVDRLAFVADGVEFEPGPSRVIGSEGGGVV